VRTIRALPDIAPAGLDGGIAAVTLRAEPEPPEAA
jgi:hypothetical protein